MKTQFAPNKKRWPAHNHYQHKHDIECRRGEIRRARTAQTQIIGQEMFAPHKGARPQRQTLEANGRVKNSPEM